MRNTLRVLKRDFTRLVKAPAALIVALFLMILPSLYAWFNVYGFWNPYDNTGNMRVCVVNEDTGAYSAATGTLDIGNQIVDSLRENKQLGWEFTDRATAMEEVKSGKAYAAFIIPKNFSTCITTFLSGDIEQPKLEYYVNEKSGAVSPKITDTGATTLDETINSSFVSVVSGVVTQKIDDAVANGNLDISQVRSSIVNDIQEIRNGIDGAREAADHFAGTADTTREKAAQAKRSLESAQNDISRLSDDLADLGAKASSAQGDLLALAATLSSALDNGDATVSRAATEAQKGAAKTAQSLVTAKGDVDAALSSTKALSEQTQVLINQTQSEIDALPQGDPSRAQLEQSLALLRQVKNSEDSTISKLNSVSSSLETAANTADECANAIENELSSLEDAEQMYRGRLSSETIPAISANLTRLSNALSSLSEAVASQTLLVGQAIAIADELSGALDNAAYAMQQTSSLLSNLDHKLAVAQTDIAALSSSNALSALLENGTLDAQKISDFMLSPTEIKTETLYQLNAYGSSMAPLFMNLTLWIGVFMLLVILKHEVDDEGIPNLTTTQRYLGRLLFFAPFAVMQAIICCAGLLVIGVQTANVFLFFLTAIIASLTYLCIQFSLVVTMQHIGMGLCIVLVFVQIPGATGLYPVEMTPDFFKTVYPLFPFTYGINALRETIGGFYANAWMGLIGKMLVFMVIFFLIGLLVRPYFTNLNRLFAKEIKETGIINGEDMQIPPRRFRAGQIFAVLAQREETRKRIQANMDRFIRWYPLIIRGLVIFGIGVPALLTTIMSLLGVEKVILLTIWLICLIIVLVALVVVAYIRDSLSRLEQLSDLSEEELREIYESRDNLEGVPVSHMHGTREVLKK